MTKPERPAPPVRTRKTLRKMRGREWYAWAFYSPEWSGDGLSHFAEAERPARDQAPQRPGKWVRVKFVQVDP